MSTNTTTAADAADDAATDALHDALHAAATWLTRAGLPPALVALRIRPSPAAVGTAIFPACSISWRAGFDDDSADLADAAAPLVQSMLLRLTPRARELALTTPEITLQLWLRPNAACAALLAEHGGRIVELVDAHLEPGPDALH